MKKAIALIAAAALAGMSAASFAAEPSVEDTCKAEAKKQHVTADKMKEFMKSCVEKRTNASTQAAPAPTAPAAPSAPAQ